MTGRTHKLSGELLGSITFVGLSLNHLYNQYETAFMAIEHSIYASILDVQIDKANVFSTLLTQTYWSKVINSIVFLILLRMIAKFTSVFPDFDQTADTMPYKESLLAKLFNRTLHLLGAHHRSRHTHSIDLTLLLCSILLLVSIKITSIASIATLFVIGLTCGLVSHIIADMFNSTGVWPVFWARRKIAFVPKKVNSLLLGTLGLAVMIISAITAVILASPIAFGVCIACGLGGGTLVVIAICCNGMTFTTGGQWEEMFYKAINIVDKIVTCIAFITCFI